MGRQIVTDDEAIQSPRASGTLAEGVGGGVAGATTRTARTPQDKADAFTDRLLKYIPTEVVALYVTLDGLSRAAPPNVPKQALLWIVFFVLLVGTWFYLRRVQAVKKVEQLIISTLAFAVWVFSLGGPFAAYPWWSPFLGTMLLPLYTFVIPIFQPKR